MPSREEGESCRIVPLAVPPLSAAEINDRKLSVDESQKLTVVDEVLGDGTTGRFIKPQLVIVGKVNNTRNNRPSAMSGDRSGDATAHRSGLKKRGRSGREGGPPTPWGCEWRKDERGWNLWRCWSENDESTGKRVSRSRYAGYLSQEAWEVMKGYDYETFLSIIGQRFRRHGKR
jgi:hypothetical protein